MFCTACGTSLPEDAAFCSLCGRATHHADATDVIPSPSSAASPALAGGDTVSLAEPSIAARSWSEARGIPYLYQGRWWSSGPSGEIVVWDSLRQDWDLALSTQTPFFMRRPRFTSLRTPALWTCILLGFFMLFSLMAVAADIEQTVVTQQLRDGESVTEEELEDAQALFEAMKGLQGLAVVGTAPLFIWWLQRSIRNLRALGSQGQSFSPGWAIGWWFIPFANLVQPLRVALEAYRASDRTSIEPDVSWRARGNDALVIIWWLGCVAGWIGSNLVISQLDAMDLRDQERTDWSIVAAAVDTALIGVAALAIFVVVRLTRRQETANRRFDVPANPAAVSGNPSAAAQPSY